MTMAIRALKECTKNHNVTIDMHFREQIKL